MSSPSPRRYVAFSNSQSTGTDYRIAFAQLSSDFDCYFVKPVQPSSVTPDRWIRLDITDGLSFRNLWQLRRVPRILRDIDADAAHFFTTQLTTFGPLLARMTGTTPVVTITGLGRAFVDRGVVSTIMRGLYLAMFELNVRLCPLVLFQSKQDHARLTSRLSERLKSRCKVIGSAIDVRAFPLRHYAANSSDYKPRCLMVGRVVPRKGIPDYLAIARRLQHKAKFTLVGGGGTDGDLLRQVKKAAEAGIIDYLGAVDPGDMHKIYVDHDIFVFPSYGEGIPRSLMEASCCGLPAATYDLAGCQAVLGGITDFAPVGDITALTDLVEHLIDFPEERQRLGTAAHHRIVDRHTVQGYAAALQRHLNAVLPSS